MAEVNTSSTVTLVNPRRVTECGGPKVNLKACADSESALGVSGAVSATMGSKTSERTDRVAARGSLRGFVFITSEQPSQADEGEQPDEQEPVQPEEVVQSAIPSPERFDAETRSASCVDTHLFRG